MQAADQAQQLSGQTGFLLDPAIAAQQQGLTGAGVGTDTLSQFAQGNFGPNNLNQVIANRQLDTSDVIRRMTAGAGRSGSPAETGILARELGKIGLEAELGQRSGDLGRQASAAEALSGQRQGLIGATPGLQQGQEFGINLLERAGLIRQGASQQEIDSVLKNIQDQQGTIFPAAGLGSTASETFDKSGTTSGTSSGTTQGTKQGSILDQISQGIGIGTSLFGVGPVRGGLFGS